MIRAFAFALAILSATSAFAGDSTDCIQKRDPATSIRACSNLIAAGEGILAYFNRGRAFTDRGEYDRAIADFDMAIQLKPDFAEAYIRRGWSYWRKGDDIQALSDFDRAILLEPDSAVAYLNRGNFLHGQGQHSRAIADYDKALRLHPGYAEAYLNRGWARRSTGDLEGALEDYKAALGLLGERDPRRSTAVEQVTALAHQATTSERVGLTRRVALIVANVAYRGVQIGRPSEADADSLIRPALEKMGFQVTVLKDANLETFNLELGNFYKKARGADVALFYFSGRGFSLNNQRGRQDYLMSTTADSSSINRMIRASGVELDGILSSIAKAAKVSLVFVDTNRTDPRIALPGAIRTEPRTPTDAADRGGRARGEDRELQNIFVGFSTRPDRLAKNGDRGSGSPFARAFAQYMAAPGVRLDDAFRQIRRAVAEQTEGNQRPEAHDDLNTPVVLVDADKGSLDDPGGETFISGAVTFQAGMTSQAVVDMLNADQRLAGAIGIVPPEGSLMPGTYKFTIEHTREQILGEMLWEQARALEQIWAERVPGLPLKTPKELLILASIAAKETNRPSELPRFAAVFMNRLLKGMRLQSDPTVMYGLFGGAGRPPNRAIYQFDLEKGTPYNTYQISGLPPTPIANPGRAALEAVAHPLRTADLYFVGDGAGGHVFATTLEEHNRNVAHWRQVRANQERLAEELPAGARLQAEQRAIYYFQGSAEAAGLAVDAATTWAEITKDGRPAIQATVRIADRDARAVITISKNYEPLPASHLIEMRFEGRLAASTIQKVPALVLKTTEQARGQPLRG